MEKLFSLYSRLGPVVLRYSMAAVILWFGIQQFLHTETWTAYVPDSATALTHLSATTLVYINGTFEVLFGFLLVFGIQVRLTALLLALHLLILCMSLDMERLVFEILVLR